MASCDTCAYNVYDDEDECYYCEVDMDEDDAVRMRLIGNTDLELQHPLVHRRHVGHG